MSPIEPGYSLLTLLLAFAIGIVIGRVTAKARRARHAQETPAGGHENPSRGSDTITLPSAELRAEIETLLADDRKIEAIRVARAALGLGLKEAKDLVESIEASNSSGGARVF